MVVKIVTDSTAYLPRHILQEFDIAEVSLAVNFPDKTFKEVDITNEEFYKIMAESKSIPTSSQPSPADFLEAFSKIIEAGNQVVGVFLSSDLSGTYYSAFTAKNMLLERYPEARIELIDSRLAAPTVGYSVTEGAKAALQGLSAQAVAERVREVIQKGRLYFAPHTLEYLKKGGRIGGASALIGSLLKVRPILTIVEGKVAVFNKVRTDEKAIDTMLEMFAKDHQKFGVREVTVLNINYPEGAQQIAQKITEISGLQPEIGHIGPVLGLHVGPGTLGLAYYTN